MTGSVASRRLISSGGPFEAVGGYSRAVVVGDGCWVAGTTGHDTAAFSGTLQPGHIDVVAMIEVR